MYDEQAIGFLTTANSWGAGNYKLLNEEQAINKTICTSVPEGLLPSLEREISDLPLLQIRLAPSIEEEALDKEVFLVRERIAEGGMGIIHGAVQSKLGREVALKRLKKPGRK